MVTAKQVINSIKPNLSNPPIGVTKKGSAGYDNVRDDIEKTKSLREGSIQKVPVNNDDIVNKKFVDDQFPVTHASTTGQTTDDHHTETHTIVSHDTTATGAELNTLTDNSIANTLHRHSELVASDGAPDPAVSVDAAGNVGIGTDAPEKKVDILGDLMIASSKADTTNKLGRIYTTHYEIAEEDFLALDLRCLNGKNEIYYGGGAGSYNSATSHSFFTGANSKTLTGTLRMVLDNAGNLKLLTGAISSATSTFSTLGPTDNVDVSGINTLFIDTTSNNVTIGGFSGGVDGQYLNIVKTSYSNDLILEHNEGGGSQDLMMHQEADEIIDAGGVLMVCDGTDWWDCSHAKHI